MVRSLWVGALIALFVGSGAARAQAPAQAWFVTVKEANRPAVKCRVLKCWRERDGSNACEVQAVATGERITMTLLDRQGGRGALATVYHWGSRDGRPPVGVPAAPPDAFVVATPIFASHPSCRVACPPPACPTLPSPPIRPACPCPQVAVNPPTGACPRPANVPDKNCWTTKTSLPGVPAVTSAVALGRDLLERARLELEKHEMRAARCMAETALTSCPGVKEEALALLRTIDAAEFNHKCLQARSGFDDAVRAFNRGDTAQARAMIAALDPRLLDADRQRRLREMKASPAMNHQTGPELPNVAWMNHAGPPPTDDKTASQPPMDEWRESWGKTAPPKVGAPGPAIGPISPAPPERPGLPLAAAHANDPLTNPDSYLKSFPPQQGQGTSGDAAPLGAAGDAAAAPRESVVLARLTPVAATPPAARPGFLQRLFSRSPPPPTTGAASTKEPPLARGDSSPPPVLPPPAPQPAAPAEHQFWLARLFSRSPSPPAGQTSVAAAGGGAVPTKETAPPPLAAAPVQQKATIDAQEPSATAQPTGLAMVAFSTIEESPPPPTLAPPADRMPLPPVTPAPAPATRRADSERASDPPKEMSGVMRPLEPPIEAGTSGNVMRPLTLEPPTEKVEQLRSTSIKQATPPSVPIPAANLAAAPPTDVAVYEGRTLQLMMVLGNAVLPPERQTAAEGLANCDWRKQPNVVEALLHAARNDPAPAVRASCVSALARMRVMTPAVLQTVEALKFDSDLRVRQAVLQALAVLMGL